MVYKQVHEQIAHSLLKKKLSNLHPDIFLVYRRESWKILRLNQWARKSGCSIALKNETLMPRLWGQGHNCSFYVCVCVCVPVYVLISPFPRAIFEQPESSKQADLNCSHLNISHSVINSQWLHPWVCIVQSWVCSKLLIDSQQLGSWSS